MEGNGMEFVRDVMPCGKQTLASLQIKAECELLCPNEDSEALSGNA